MNVVWQTHIKGLIYGLLSVEIFTFVLANIPQRLYSKQSTKEA